MILDEVRKQMKKENVDYYIIPTLDPHGSEYLPDYYRERAYVTGFTGSAGTAVISQESAYLWTDGRYFIQAERQIKANGFKLMKMGIEGYPTYPEWISQNIKNGEIVGMNFKYYLQNAFEELENALSGRDIKIEDKDLIKDIWIEKRPELPLDKLMVHDIKYCGETHENKLLRVRKKMEEQGIDSFIITSLDDIAWLYNIRCTDIEDTPVAISYAIIEKERAYFFIDNKKLDEKSKKHIEKVAEIKGYDDVFQIVSEYKNKTVYVDKSKINHKLYNEIDETNNIVAGRNITTDLKGIKNEVELENLRKTSIRDGVAVVKFIYWLKNEIKNREISEIEVSEKLRSFREQGENFVMDSFGTIAAYGANAAMAHYSATPDNYSMLKDEGLLLVDSGAQYYDGTTDITRTIALGKLRDVEIHDFTLVLKSHLALMTAKFLKGTTDSSLDIISRYPIWKENKDYKHGTGHGVGFFLSVHEGPHSISPRNRNIKMVPGMVVSNEPGLYIEGSHGIRTENIVEVINDTKNEFGEFYKLRNLSYVPIDIDAIDIKMLTDDEKDALNEYHREVYEKISPNLEENEIAWLKEVTKEI